MNTILFTPFDKVFLEIMWIKFHYYWLMYAIWFSFWYLLLSFLLKKEKIILSEKEFDRMFFWIAIFWLIWGRIWHILIYNFSYYFQNPLEIFAVWKWWMASHWWLIWWLIWFFIFKPKDIDYKKILDLTVIPLSFWLWLWRIWNFINWELYWKASSMPWCMYFDDNICRHPTQLYAFIKDILIFLILFYLYKKWVRNWFLVVSFLILYWSFRFFVEFFKENTQGNNTFSFITTGQVLSIFIILSWIIFWLTLKQKNNKEKSKN